MSNFEQLQQDYNIHVRILECKEINRVPLEELLATGLTQERVLQLKDMFSVVIEDDRSSGVMLLIPTAEVKSSNERILDALVRQRENLEVQIDKTRQTVQKERTEQESQKIKNIKNMTEKEAEKEAESENQSVSLKRLELERMRNRFISRD